MTSNMPSENSEGHQTWSPSVGLYFKPADDKAHSYGGVIASLQDTLARGQYTVKSYPENFAGIIAAIQDLKLGEYQPGSDAGPLPPGDSIDNSDPSNPIYNEGAHENGQLWFDTRQGRLFIYLNGDWTQTNGADGLPLLLPNTTPPSGDVVVPGQLWFDTLTDTLYIFSGTWIDPAGIAVDLETRDIAPTDTPVWKPISGSGGGSQTTATLPLIATITEDPTVQSLPDIDMSAMNNQNDYNEWLYDALVSLDGGLSSISAVSVGESAPDTPQVGDLWYDVNSLDLSIWYDDGQSQQWVPTSPSYTLNEDIQTLSLAFEQDKVQKNLQILNINSAIDQLTREDDSKILEITQDLAALDFKVNQLPVYDLQPYALSSDVTAGQDAAIDRISALEIATASLNDYQTKLAAEAKSEELLAVIAEKATPEQVSNVLSQIPDVSSYVTQEDIDSSVAAITNNFIPRTGGTINGQFVVNKADIAKPAFDVSQEWANSQQLFKLKSYSPNGSTATFGATDSWWQYAWQFNGHEDFAWVHDGNKVFSISESGPACSTLHIGQFQSNDQNGRRVVNTIEVGEQLRSHKQTFADIRQAVSTSTDYESLKAALLTALPNS